MFNPNYLLSKIKTKYKETNKKFYEVLPYTFFLDRVVQVFNNYKYLLPRELYTSRNFIYYNEYEDEDITEAVIKTACYGHDYLSFWDIGYEHISFQSQYIADLIYALTFKKGKDEFEPYDDAYFQGLKAVPGGIFCFLCLHIAQARFYVYTQDEKMIEKSASKLKIYKVLQEASLYQPMWQELELLLTEKKGLILTF